MLDLLIKNGTIIDGTGRPRVVGNVGICGDRIQAVGQFERAEARETIDAAGKVIAPGFIDVHTHADGWMLKVPHIESKTLQGFTTEVLMLDGIGYAPVNQYTAEQWLFYLRTLDGLLPDDYQGWRSLSDFFECLDGCNVQNAALHIPYANVRSLVCGFGNRPVDDFQMRSIQDEIRVGMAAGAVGLSTGLDYIVQCFTTTDELVEACSAMSEYDGLYVTHIRYKKGLMNGLKEAVEIGKRAGVRVHISHLKAQSPEGIEEVIGYIDNVARNEVDFSFDVYPYQPGSTMLSYLMPYEIWEDGPLAAIDKMKLPEIRERVRHGLNAYRLDLDHIHIAWVAGSENSRHQGKLLSQYIEETGLPAEEALINLLIEERLAVLLVFDEGDDALVEPFLAHDLYMMGTDGIYTDNGPVHPRQFGSTGRLLGPCVRDQKLFSLEQAVHNLTGRPAERFRLPNRGIIAEGRIADIVVFDPETITDHATFENPRQNTTGIETVLVSGTPIIQNRTPVDPLPTPLPGRALRCQR